MTQHLHDSLTDLVSDVPHHVGRDDLAAHAWAAGRRRRTRRRALGTGAAAVLVALLALAAPRTLESHRPPAPADTRPAVDGYPQRIGRPWWLRALPDRPGPVAAVAWRNAPDDSSWLAVGPTGRLWRVPVARAADVMPMLSRDGTRLGYLEREAGPFVLQDLVTGRRTEFPDVGASYERVHTRYWLSPQMPGFWSPDGTRVLVQGAARAPHLESSALILGVDGRDRLVPGERALGWVSDDRIAWMDWRDRDVHGGVTAAVTVRVTDLAGRTVRTVRLDLDASLGLEVDQWTGSVSPDGRTVALVEQDTSTGGDTRAWLFSLADGSLRREAFPPATATSCPTSWRGRSPVVPSADGDGALAWTALRTPQPVTVADPRLHLDCLAFAEAALTGEPHGGAPVVGSVWWTWCAWHARDLALGGIAVALALLLGLLRRRHHRA